MNRHKIVATTISLARSSQEEKRIQDSLKILSGKNLEAITIVDGGSSRDFISEIKKMPNVNLEIHPELSLQESIKKSLTIAKSYKPTAIFYTESDKKDFFKNNLEIFLDEALTIIENDPNFGIIIPSRTKESFSKFPAFQQYTENTINNLIGNFLDEKNSHNDYCYGPRIISPKLITYIDKLPKNIGWGWLSFLLITSALLGKKNYTVQLNLPSPTEEFTEKEKIKLYRTKQLIDHAKGILEAYKLPI